MRLRNKKGHKLHRENRLQNSSYKWHPVSNFIKYKWLKHDSEKTEIGRMDKNTCITYMLLQETRLRSEDTNKMETERMGKGITCK